MKSIRILAALGLVLPTACTVPTITIGSGSGEATDMAAVVEASAKQDVVFFGEVHSSDECHEQQRQLLVALRQKRPDLVVSMEMFERDVQPHLDAYMAGKMSEQEFKSKARAWPNWHHYRPIVQFAAMQGLPVIAANAPRDLVRQVSREGGGGLEAVLGNPNVAREVQAPKDAYYDAFVMEMAKGQKEASVDPKSWIARFYEAQVLRDETMAESIADYLEKAHAAGRRPLVVHLCGNFHSARRRGTVARLERRMPKLKILVIATTQAGTDASKGPTDLGDFHLTVPRVPEKTDAAHPKPAHPKPAHPHGAPKSGDTKSTLAKPAATTTTDEKPDPNARPGLGFMPAYDGEAEGCGVATVMEGSAAAKAGIKEGDVIIKMASEDIDSVRTYSEVLGGLRVGQKVVIVVLRDGKEVKLDAILGESRR